MKKLKDGDTVECLTVQGYWTIGTVGLNGFPIKKCFITELYDNTRAHIYTHYNESDKISPLNCHVIACHELDAFKLIINRNVDMNEKVVAKPMYCKLLHAIFFTTYSKQSDSYQLYKYNINLNTTEDPIKIPEHKTQYIETPIVYSQSIANNIIYFVSMFDNKILSYNLITSSWNTDTIKNGSVLGTDPDCNIRNACFISNKNEIHLVSHIHHKLDCNTRTKHRLNGYGKLIQDSKTFYVESLNKLIAVGGFDDEYNFLEEDRSRIFCYDDVLNTWKILEFEHNIPKDLYTIDNKDYGWTRNYPSSNDAVLGLNHILFKFDTYLLECEDMSDDIGMINVEIYDLLYAKKYALDRSKPFPRWDRELDMGLGIVQHAIDGEHTFAVCDSKNNEVHVMDFYAKVHYKFSLYDVIPAEMNEFYRQKYDALVFGYYKKIQNEMQLSYSIPFYLVKLIVSFYPNFNCKLLK